MDKRILDACCGSRMFWFDKHNKDAIFQDIRDEEQVLCDGRKLYVKPDVVGDFRNMAFPDETFYLVVFDPPHLNHIGKSSWMAKKYGILSPSWQDDIRQGQGFRECMRVLKTNGTLIFKWNEDQIPVRKIIDVIGCVPLFGHTTRRNSTTVWMAFMK
jgi:hypothetical protein